MRAEAYRIMEGCEETYWWYRVRREIIADTARRFVPPGGDVLDYGCGHGATADRLRRLGYRVTVTDVAATALDACRRRGLPVVDPNDLGPPGDGYDLALACDVLEHVEDDAALLRRLRDALQPGGLVLVTVPAYEFLWSGEDYVSEHVRRYTRRRLASVLRASGFEVTWESYFNTVLFPPILAAILWKRLFRPRDLYRSNVEPLPPRLDAALGRAFALERPWLRHLRFPFGLSLIAVARRAETAAAGREGEGRGGPQR
jgi:SAM-dependent methyltransferase